MSLPSGQLNPSSSHSISAVIRHIICRKHTRPNASGARIVVPSRLNLPAWQAGLIGKITIDQDHVKSSSRQNKSPVAKTSTVICDQSSTWCNTARHVHNVYFRVSFSLPVTVFTLTVALCMGSVHRPIFAIHAGVLLE